LVKRNSTILKTRENDGPRRRRGPVERVQALGRAIGLLEHVAEGGTTGVALKALSAAAGLNASTAHNLLSSLMAHGYVEQHPTTGAYRLGPGPLQLANRFLAHCDLRELAMPLLQDLHAQLDEWVVLSMLRAGREFNVASIQSRRPLVVNPGGLGGFGGPGDLGGLGGLASVGALRAGGARGALGIDPNAGLNCTAVGKVLLSSMDPVELDALLRAHAWSRHTPHTITDPDALRREVALVRARGYATNVEEHYEGLRAVAAPVHDATGRITAALGVAYPTLRATPEREAQITVSVRRAAAELSLRLGYAPAAGAIAALDAGTPHETRDPAAAPTAAPSDALPVA
jgi:DNA-binding IclR family transcriptional regulator